MKLKQLLSWRFSLIFFHRWLGIAVGLMFVAWCISGFVLMYAGIPHIKAGERLSRLPDLDLSTATITPQQALDKVGGTPFRLRISMQGERPVYRINTGAVFGQWTLVYADNGEVLKTFDEAAALDWVATRYPEHKDSLRYETLLTGPDMFTHSPALQTHMPMHRIALDDADATEYYVSANTGEAVMKTTRGSRILGFLGYNLHTLFFFRQATWWTPLLHWLSYIGLGMTVLGIVLGIWRFSSRPVHIKRGVAYRTPYAGWWKWHHYAGLIFGALMLTWMVSGIISMSIIPGITETLYTPAQLQAGARTVQGFGPPVDYKPLTLDGIRHAADTIGREFAIKELELLYYNDEPHYVAYRAPTADEVTHWQAHSAMEFITQYLDHDHRIISAVDTSAHTFTDFSEADLLQAAATAMPGHEYVELTWLREHDDYYYQTIDTFDLGLPRTVRTLPVLRLKYDDPQQTWLYLTPSHGQLIKAEIRDRRNRWGYYGMHGLDFAFLWNARPLWDIVVLILLLGCFAMSTTTLVPMYDRLKRHTLRLLGLAK
jgi:hypothetical protein